MRSFRSVFPVHLVVALVVLIPSVSWAVSGRDKAAGEADQIEARERWFIESRGLDKVENAQTRRLSAVDGVRRSLAENRAPTLNWTNLGPEPMTMMTWAMGNVSGRVSALAVHPFDENTIYLGAASGGLWKTTNAGASWVQLFDSVGTHTIGAIFIDPMMPDTIWVGTGEQGQWCSKYFGQGLYVSNDGGATFTAMNGTAGASLDLAYISSIVVNPSDPMNILVGGHADCPNGVYTAGGLFQSLDGGTTWTRKYSGPVNDIVIDPAANNIVYSAWGRWGWSNDGVYKSTDSGGSWTRLTNGIPYGTSVYRIRLAMAPSNSQILYALVNESGASKIYQTTNGGTSWSVKNSNACEGQCDYNLCLAVDPFMPSVIAVGSIRHAISTDSGATLNYRTTTWGSAQSVHQDTHVLAFSNTTPSRYWVGTDGGLWRTDDAGSTFVNLNSNLNITQFYEIAVHPDDSGIIFGGAQDNSSLRRNGSSIWDVTVVSGDGFMNLVDPDDPTVVFQTSYPSSGYPWPCKSTAGGAPGTCNWLNPGGLTSGEPYPWVTPMAIADPDVAQPTQVFLASNYVYMAAANQTAGSFTWTKISPNLAMSTSQSVSVITPFGMGSGIVGLYVGTETGRIWRCDDAMVPSPVFTDVTGDYPGGWVSDLAVDPTDFNRVWVTRSEFGGDKLLRSDAGGGTWMPMGVGLPDVPANAVAADPVLADRVFVGTDVGVFESRDGGINCSLAGSGLPLGIVVTDLDIDDEPYVLTAGTYGRGAWQLELGAKVTGQVILSPSRLDGVVATVEGIETGGSTLVGSTITDPAGAYSLTLPHDTYRIVVDHSHSLWAESSPDISGGGTIVLSDVTLLIGDANGDGTINITDITTVAGNFGGADAQSDMNGDGTVNISDITTVSGNFGSSAPTPW